MHGHADANEGRLGLAWPEGAEARRAEQRWRPWLLLALVATTPAFYLELLSPKPSWGAGALYGLAATVLAAAGVHVAMRSPRPLRHLRRNLMDPVLVAGLLAAAVLPSSHGAPAALWLRLAVAVLCLLRMLWTLQPTIRRGSVLHLLLMAALVLVLCGAGYWWLEPTTPTFADGLWLAFVTASTVGYGDVVPTVPASRIFSFFVALLGFAVLTLVTAGIAAQWVGSEERAIEREILRDLHAQVGLLRREIAALSRPGSATAPVGRDGQQAVEDQ